MAEIDYNEILLEAIDAVVSSRLADVNFDRTIVATITDASKAKEGEYTLSNESIEFVATSENTNYKKNDRVNVLIPSNDYSNPKTILGKCATKENETPVAYVSPLQKIIMAGQNYTKDKSAKLRANTNKDGSAKMVEICTKTVTENSTSFDTLYVSADFKTLFSGYDMRTGRFGLLITMETDGGYTHAVTLDSAKDMFGNPYNFFAPFTQEQAYELNLPDKVKSITVHLYEMGDFTYNDGISPQPVRLGYVEYDNILVNNISVGFGYNAEQVPDNTVKIHAASLTYDNIKDSDIEKKIELTWYNKDENNKYLGFTDGTFDQQDTSGKPKYTIKWYHSQNNGNWKDLDEGLEKPKFTNQTTIYAPINSKWAVNEYKAVIYVLESGQDEPNSYTSNVLTFKVATGYDSNIHDALNMNLTLHNGAESLDAYPFYGADSAIINPGEASKNRSIYFSYAGATGNILEPDILNGATAYFYIPTISTMLELPYGVDPCGEEQGYKVYKKTYTNEFNEIKSGSFNILKNTAPSELIGAGKNYNYTKAIYGWESGSGTVTARSTDSGKKTIRLANETDTNATLQAMQSVSLKKDKEYTISTLVYPKQAEGIQISLSYEDGTKEVLNTTITSHDSNWNKVVATLKPNAEKTGVLKICLEASVKNKSYVLWHETMLVEGSNAAEKWRPAENEIDEHLNAEKTFTYRVKEIYNPLFKNNEVKLKIVDKNGFEYSAVKSFSFSSYGTSGTDYTLVIEDPEQQIATLYDANYKPVEATITWGFYPQYSNNTVTKDSGYKVAKASTSVNWVSGTVNLSALKGIPLETNEYYYQGPTTIVYDSSGVNPKYYDGDLGLFVKATNEPVTGLTWSLQYYNYNNLNAAVSSPVGLSNYPQLTGAPDGNRRLKAPSMFLTQSTESSDPYYYIVLVASKGNNVYWRQPLIILQNQHSSTLLNNWDGELQVDRENNYILSAMMGAGSKNSNNEFTGVIMGNTAKLDGNGAWSNAEHGLFGYHKGAQSFGFKTDGKAFIGKAGSGRIEFDGDKGVIQSANFDKENASGSKWDLDDGSLVLKGQSSYFKFNENNSGKLEMKISGANIVLEDDSNKTLNASVSGKIEASANGLKTEFKQTANYFGTCTTADGTNPKIIENSGMPETIGKGLIINIAFTQPNTRTTAGLQFKFGEKTYGVVNSPLWEAGEALSFSFNGTGFELTSLSHSSITQTADNIRLEVQDTETRLKGTIDETATTLQSEIDQTAEKIALYVGKSSSRYDTSSIKDKLVLYGEEMTPEGLMEKYPPNKYNGKIYLDITTGYYYTSNGSTWTKSNSPLPVIADGLSTAIQQTADAVNFIASSTMFYGTCDTASGATPKEVKLSNPSAFPSIYKDELDVYVNEKGNPINGLSLAVKFTQANTADAYFALSEDKNNNNEEVWYKNSRTAEDNPFHWNAGDVIIFTYANGHWNVSEYGSYSQIEITKEAITSTVERIAPKVQFYGTCETAKDVVLKSVVLSDSRDFPKMASDKYPTGTTISVRFVNGHDNQAMKLSMSHESADVQGEDVMLKGETSIPKLSSNDSLIFVYDASINGGNGAWVIADNGSYSQIKSTADSIAMSVGKSDAVYDTSKMTTKPTLYGIGAPSYAASSHKNKIYLDTASGYYYTSNGSTWTKSSSALSFTTGELKSLIEQKPDSITLSVSGSLGGTAAINLIVDGVTQKGSIDLTGAVKFTDLESNSSTKINGDYITTGTIDTGRLNVSSIITAGKADIKKLAAEQIAATSITASKLTVKNTSGGVLLSAGNNVVTIGGWSVGANSLTNGIFGLYVNGGSLSNKYPFADTSAIVLQTSQTVTSSTSAQSITTVGHYWKEIGRITNDEVSYSISFMLPDSETATAHSLDPTNDDWKGSVELINPDNCRVFSCTKPTVSYSGRVTCTIVLKVLDDTIGGAACQGLKLHYIYTRNRKAVTYELPAFAVTKNGFMACSSGSLGSQWVIQPDGLHSSIFYAKDVSGEYGNITLTANGVEERVYSGENFNNFKRVERARSWREILQG